MSRFCQTHAVSVTPKEHHAAVVLQHPQAAAQGGLRNLKPPGRSRNAAAFDDAHESAQQGNIPSGVIQFLNNRYGISVATQKAIIRENPSSKAKTKPTTHHDNQQE